MKSWFVLSSFILTVGSGFANPDSTSNWKKGAILNLSVTQVSLNNWAGGGQNAISANGLINLSANYAKDKLTWDNSLDLGYGLVNQAKLPWWEKSDDRIDLSSKLGRHAFKHWYYSGLLNFKSQFTPGFDKAGIKLADRNIISDFLAPGYLIVGLGMDYKPNDKFTFFLAPLTGKTTFVMNQDLADAGAFGVSPATKDAVGLPIAGTGTNIRNEFGGYLKIMYTQPIMTNITFQTKLELFSNYLNNPQNIDVNWECLLNMKINKYISATLSTLLIYDDDINIAHDFDENNLPRKFGPITQFKEVFSVGFTYKL